MLVHLISSVDDDCRASSAEYATLPDSYYGNNDSYNPSIDEEECYGSDGTVGMWRPSSSPTYINYRSVIDAFGHKITFCDTFDRKTGNLLKSEDVSWLFPDDFERNRLDTCRIEVVHWDYYGEHKKKVRETKCKNKAGTVFWTTKVTTYPDGRIVRETNSNIKYNR